MTDQKKVIKEFDLFIKEFHPACTSEGVELDMLREVLALLKEQGNQIEQLEHDLAVAQSNLNYYVNGND